MSEELVTLDIGGMQVQGIMTEFRFSGMTRDVIDCTSALDGGYARSFMPGIVDPGELTVTYKLAGQPMSIDDLPMPTAVEPSWPDPTAELPYVFPECLRRPITDWGRDWRVLAIACLLAWAICGGCIAPSFHYHSHNDTYHGVPNNADVSETDAGNRSQGVEGPAGHDRPKLENRGGSGLRLDLSGSK